MVKTSTNSASFFGRGGKKKLSKAELAAQNRRRNQSAGKGQIKPVGQFTQLDRGGVNTFGTVRGPEGKKQFFSTSGRTPIEREAILDPTGTKQIGSKVINKPQGRTFKRGFGETTGIPRGTGPGRPFERQFNEGGSNITLNPRPGSEGIIPALPEDIARLEAHQEGQEGRDLARREALLAPEEPGLIRSALATIGGIINRIDNLGFKNDLGLEGTPIGIGPVSGGLTALTRQQQLSNIAKSTGQISNEQAAIEVAAEKLLAARGINTKIDLAGVTGRSAKTIGDIGKGPAIPKAPTWKEFTKSKEFITNAQIAKKFPNYTQGQRDAIAVGIGNSRVTEAVKDIRGLKPKMWKKIAAGGIVGGVYTANKIFDAQGLALWAGTDNVMGQTAFYSKTVADSVIFNGADPEEALLLLDKQQENLDIGREATKLAEGNPYMWNYRQTFTAAGEISQATMDLNRQRILDFMKGGI